MEHQEGITTNDCKTKGPWINLLLLSCLTANPEIINLVTSRLPPMNEHTFHMVICRRDIQKKRYTKYIAKQHVVMANSCMCEM